MGCATVGPQLLSGSSLAAQVQRFPFPSPPAAGALTTAAALLTAIGALHPEPTAAQPVPEHAPGGLTALGQGMAKLPLNPRHACLLLQVIC